jgi:hypothetical protein
LAFGGTLRISLNAEIEPAPGMSVPSLMSPHTGAVFWIAHPLPLPSNPHAVSATVLLYESRLEMALMSTWYVWLPGIT